MDKRKLTEEEIRRVCQFISLLDEINKRVKIVPTLSRPQATAYVFGSPMVIPDKQCFNYIAYKSYTQYLF